MCKNDTTLSVTMLGQQWEQQSNSSAFNGTVTVTVTAPSTPTATATKNSAAEVTAGAVTLVSVVGMACVLAAGLGL